MRILRTGLISLGVVVSMTAFATSVHAAAYDPWEPVNIRVHALNEIMDSRLLKPAANAYVRYLPQFARRGVSNFFSNIGDVSILANNVLQLKFDDALSDSGRLLLNTTVGIGGLLDVATPVGLEKNDEDFGQTLGRWGVGPGPYVVLPLFGPSTLRDTLGLGVDTYTNPLNNQDNLRLRNTAFVLQQLDRRVTGLALDSLMLGDTYIFSREAYIQQREYLVTDGEIDDSWDDDDWGSWD
jgi:phospholipid-binding lipoprotein MlaA